MERVGMMKINFPLQMETDKKKNDYDEDDKKY